VLWCVVAFQDGCITDALRGKPVCVVLLWCAGLAQLQVPCPIA